MDIFISALRDDWAARAAAVSFGCIRRLWRLSAACCLATTRTCCRALHLHSVAPRRLSRPPRCLLLRRGTVCNSPAQLLLPVPVAAAVGGAALTASSLEQEAAVLAAAARRRPGPSAAMPQAGCWWWSSAPPISPSGSHASPGPPQCCPPTARTEIAGSSHQTPVPSLLWRRDRHKHS